VKVVVTGASGKAGRAVVRDLLEYEHEVLAVDLVSAAGARLLGLHRVVWASSETILGLPFEREQPAYALAEVYPSVPYRPTTGNFDTLLSIEKAGNGSATSGSGSWRDHIAA
jgi:hypothetical protein